ncbi:MAG TPA: CHASE2 domain-containing protein, partial [Candidatus Polarisedimenticolia bacterium]|nr:CHASE2 domain-containing protein [Candidatus Polarisedimenticolia bacterium]
MSADAEGRALRGRLTSGRVRHLCIALAVGAVSLWGGLEPLERLWMDVRFRLLQKPVEAPIVVVAIDPRSLSRLDVWPWPRGYHATVLERLLASGATRVAFDLDFSSRSIPEEDDAFAEAVRAAEGRAILPVFHRWQAEPDGSGGLIGSAPLASLSARATLASINIRPEADGLVRRYWPVDASGGPPAPSMALALMGGEPGDHDGFYLDYGLDTTTIPVISYVDVLTGEFDPAAIRGRAVIVGATAVELGDQVAVPVYVNLPGPMLQSLAFVCIQTGRGLHRLPIWFPAVVVLAAAWLAGRTLE